APRSLRGLPFACPGSARAADRRADPAPWLPPALRRSPCPCAGRCRAAGRAPARPSHLPRRRTEDWPEPGPPWQAAADSPARRCRPRGAERPAGLAFQACWRPRTAIWLWEFLAGRRWPCEGRIEVLDRFCGSVIASYEPMLTGG